MTSRVLEVDYIAPRLHCSNIRIHFIVDGAERAASGAIAPGKHSGYYDLGPVSPGYHTIALRGEGIVGGCNVGQLSAWQGSIEVWTSLASTASAAPDAPKTDAFIIKSTAVNSGWGYANHGCCLSSDGMVARYRYDRGSQIPAAAPLPADSATGAALIAHYCPGAEVVGHVEPTEIAGKQALLAIASQAPIQEGLVRIGAPDYGVDGYFLDSVGNRFQQVVLAGGGSIERINPSPAAAQLLQWMRTTLNRTGCPVL